MVDFVQVDLAEGEEDLLESLMVREVHSPLVRNRNPDLDRCHQLEVEEQVLVRVLRHQD